MLLKEIYNKKIQITDERIEQAVQVIRPVFNDNGEEAAIDAIRSIFGEDMVNVIVKIIKQTMQQKDKPTLGNELLAQYKSSGKVVPPEVSTW